MIIIGKEYGVRALILGIIALFLGFIGLIISASNLIIIISGFFPKYPIISVIGGILSAIAILFGIIGIIIDDPKELAIAGLILGILGLIPSFLVIYWNYNLFLLLLLDSDLVTYRKIKRKLNFRINTFYLYDKHLRKYLSWKWNFILIQE